MCECLGFRSLQSKDDEALQVGVDQDLLTGEKKEDVGTKHRAGESAKLKAGLNAQQKAETRAGSNAQRTLSEIRRS